MKRRNVIHIRHGETLRVIGRQDGGDVIIAEKPITVLRTAQALERHRSVRFAVGRGGLIKHLPFGADTFVYASAGEAHSVKSRNIGVKKWIF